MDMSKKEKSVRENKNIAELLLTSEDYKSAREHYVRYLAAYKVVEGNLALFDKLARCRDFNDFLSAVYESMRVKDRVLDKLEEGVKRGDYEITFECDNIKAAFSVGHDDIKKLIELARRDPKAVGTILATLALAYGGIRSR